MINEGKFVQPYPVIKAVTLDIRYADDELALSDFVMDIETIIEDCELAETTPALLREMLDAIQAGWTAAGESRGEQ